uniref:Uncharacterized protein n=1 Tax=Acrobeloides nanus TaxID=290746 RepID=A0A914CZ27_9BILA
MSQKIASNIEELERYEMEEKVLLAKKTQLESMIFATRSENEKFNNLLKQLVNCALDLDIKSNGEPATATTPARGDDKASNGGEAASDLKNGENRVEKAEGSDENMGFDL